MGIQTDTRKHLCLNLYEKFDLFDVIYHHLYSLTHANTQPCARALLGWDEQSNVHLFSQVENKTYLRTRTCGSYICYHRKKYLVKLTNIRKFVFKNVCWLIIDQTAAVIFRRYSHICFLFWTSLLWIRRERIPSCRGKSTKEGWNGYAKARIVDISRGNSHMLCLIIFSTKIVRSYLAEIGRGLYMPLFSVSLLANEITMVCYSLLSK